MLGEVSGKRANDGLKTPVALRDLSVIMGKTSNWLAVTPGGLWSGAIFDGYPKTTHHRYALWRFWDPTGLPLVVIGLNPSTATHEFDDPTIRRCLGFARDWGHGGLVMLNLFSYRGTNPKALEYRNRLRETDHEYHAWPESVTGGETHNAYLRWFTAPERAGVVLAAWGNHGWIAGRCAIVEDMLARESVQLLALGVTKQDQPLHPLYVAKATLPITFRL